MTTTAKRQTGCGARGHGGCPRILQTCHKAGVVTPLLRASTSPQRSVGCPSTSAPLCTQQELQKKPRQGSIQSQQKPRLQQELHQPDHPRQGSIQQEPRQGSIQQEQEPRLISVLQTELHTILRLRQRRLSSRWSSSSFTVVATSLSEISEKAGKNLSIFLFFYPVLLNKII